MKSTAHVNKVKFVDESIDHYISENAALLSKLQSKNEALLIMSKELITCRTERDQFKLMAEQIQAQYTSLKKKSYSVSMYPDQTDYNYLNPGTSVAQLLTETREKNKALILELDSLKQKLAEAEGDIKVLRKQASMQRCSDLTIMEKQLYTTNEKEMLVEQLEKSNLKISQLKSDLQSMLDDKEELIKERDAYKCKVHRLNHELGVMLKAENGTPLLDVDALITENHYLQERLQQAEAETHIASQALAKYRSILETKKRKGIVKFGTNNSDMIMSHKQVKQLLENGTMAELPVTAATIADMKSLCLGLLEALNDKTLALTHQRRANKILASRVTDLESRLESVTGIKNISVFPSQILLEDYCSSEVDKQPIDISAEKELIEKEHSNCTISKSANSSASSESADNFNANSKEEPLELPPQLKKLVDEALEDLEKASE